ncbi:spore germination protein GerPC [Paenibacillus sp. TRM 82003]|nr:spore germination protein GerPC [Paenibacillus sp. TRM 82003]
MDAWRYWAEEHIRCLYYENARLHDRLKQLEERLRLDGERLDAIERRPTHAVERIEYRFDQLKIESLQGTLHIGMKPDDVKSEPLWSLGDTAFPEPTVTHANSNPNPPFLTVHADVHRYVSEAVPPLLGRWCDEAGVELEPEEAERVLQDLRMQVDARIEYYMKMSEIDQTADPEGFENSVRERTIHDIELGLRTFLDRRRASAPKEETYDANDRNQP